MREVDKIRGSAAATAVGRTPLHRKKHEQWLGACIKINADP